MPGTRGWSRWSFLLAPQWLAWHLFVVAAVAGMLWLGDWQLRRAQAGNALSWGYTFEWPFFSILAVIFWVKTIRDEARPAASGDAEPEPRLPPGAMAAGAAGGREGMAERDGEAVDADAGEEDMELAAYNAYLAKLHQQVKG